MEQSENLNPLASGDLAERLDRLEKRIADLENGLQQHVHTRPYHSETSDEEPGDYSLSVKFPTEEESGEIETQIGEYGLAWLGNIVLLLGIVFLTQYVTNKGFALISGLIGFVSVAGILVLARAIRHSFSHLAFMFTIFGNILLFYTAMRLHFFTAPPVIASKGVAIALLVLIAGYQFYESVRRKSEGYAVMSLLLLICLAVISDYTHIMLPLVTVSAALSLYLFNRFGWSRLLIFSVILTYWVFLFWLVGNPLMGHPVKAVSSHQHAYLYLALCGAVYSLVTLVKQKGLFNDHVVLAVVIMNGLGFSALLGLLVISFFATGYLWIFISIAVFCLAFSALLKYRSSWRYAPALYALYGFLAVSIAFYGTWGFPRAYLLLSLQSLLVVSMALWFRSKIIVVMNLFLFITLLLAYAGMSKTMVLTNFSFALVSFLSARIINWKKDRLNIKTELIRNTYLFLLFLTLLFALYKAIPGQYVTLSWTLAAVTYFLLSILMKNVKYRYLAISTMLATVVYLFAVDLASIGIVYRIVAFLFVALISIFFSIYYVRKRKQKKADLPK